MPPKEKPPLAPPLQLNQPAAPDPSVLAAQSTLEKWEERVAELSEKLRQTEAQLERFHGTKTNREHCVRELGEKVQDIVSPKPQEPDIKPPPKKGVKNEPPPPPPPIDEEELKKQARSTQTLLNLYKKKKEKKDLSEEAGENVEEAGVHCPPEIEEELWAKVLKLRDERFEHEDALCTVRSNIETATDRKQSLLSIKQLISYSLNAAKFELHRAKEGKPTQAQQIAAQLAAAPQKTGSAQSKRSTGASHPHRPPSQLVKR